MSYRTQKTGTKVDELLDKIDDLQEATVTKSGIMSKEDKKRLDQSVADDELSISEINELLNF